MVLAIDSAKKREQQQHSDCSSPDADSAERFGLGPNELVRSFRNQNEDWIPGRMRLMMRDIKMPDAESEVDRIEIFERCWKIRDVEREKNDREENRAEARREYARAPGACPDEARGSFSRAKACHAGRSRSPSFRLPVR